jgi:hypothetical protein
MAAHRCPHHCAADFASRGAHAGAHPGRSRFGRRPFHGARRSAVVVDTGALPAGDYTIDVELDAAAVLAAGKALVVEHRNAANAATVKQLGGCSAGQSRTLTIRRLTLAANERVRVVVGAVAFGAGETATAAIQAYPV